MPEKVHTKQVVAEVPAWLAIAVHSSRHQDSAPHRTESAVTRITRFGEP
jgi:hypothetical protein